MKKNEKLYCFFCGGKESEVNYLVEGDEAYICDLCVEKANVIITENNQSQYTNVELTLKQTMNLYLLLIISK